MNNIIRKSAIVFATAAAFLFSTAAIHAQEKLVYAKELNSHIGVTVENAEGASYTVRDKKGNIVLRGKINGKKTFNLPITGLKTGDYQFCIGQYILQEFSVK